MVSAQDENKGSLGYVLKPVEVVAKPVDEPMVKSIVEPVGSLWLSIWWSLELSFA